MAPRTHALRGAVAVHSVTHLNRAEDYPLCFGAGIKSHAERVGGKSPWSVATLPGKAGVVYHGVAEVILCIWVDRDHAAGDSECAADRTETMPGCSGGRAFFRLFGSLNAAIDLRCQDKKEVSERLCEFHRLYCFVG